MEDQPLLEPFFLDDDGPSYDVPPAPAITNTRELFGLKEGESVAGTLECRNRDGHSEQIFGLHISPPK